MPARTNRCTSSPCGRAFFQVECRRQLKRHIRASARQGANPEELRALERTYHSTVRAKRRTHRLTQLRSLLAELKTDPRAFWKRLKTHQADLPVQLQTVQAWDDYLQHVADLGLPIISSLSFGAFPVQQIASLEAVAALHAPISLAEVSRGLRNLHNGRASGAQGLPAELLRYAKLDPDANVPDPGHVIAPVICAALNAAFQAGTVPSSANVSLITPVYKKGNKVDPLNYRPIAVTEPVLRLYTGILNTRLLEYTEEAGLRAETQSGFRPGHSTIHQLFTLQHFIDQGYHNKQPLYTCFLDLKGAYDRVRRNLLWVVLERLGIEGQMLAAVKSLYANNTIAIKIGSQVGRSLPTCTGLKQGCPLSPTLFGLFSDGLHRHLQLRCPEVGPQLYCGTRVRDLGYADDFALLATTPAGLQKLIDATQEFCVQTGMVICPDKTKVVVFSAGAPEAIEWRCGSAELDCVQQYKYLGVIFDAQAGMNATFATLQRNLGVHGHSLGADMVTCNATCLWDC